MVITKSRYVFAILACLILLLMFFSSLAFADQRKTVAVLPFENVSGVSDEVINGQAMASFFSAELSKNKNYLLVGRKGDLTDILEEQKLGASGLINPKTAAKLGKVTGAQYIIKGKILQVSRDDSGGALGSFFGLSSKEITVVLSLSFLDTTTGEISVLNNVVGKSSQTSFAVNDPSNGNNIVALGENKRSIFKDAAFAAVKQGVEKINELNPLAGYIVDLEGRTVYIDLGRASGVEKGQKFRVFRENKVIKHPVTGKIIGVKKQDLATLKIVDVEEEMAIGELEQGNLASMLRVGDKVRRIKQ